MVCAKLLAACGFGPELHSPPAHWSLSAGVTVLGRFWSAPHPFLVGCVIVGCISILGDATVRTSINMYRIPYNSLGGIAINRVRSNRTFQDL